MEKVLIVFDFDGTLVDSAAQFKEAIEDFYKQTLNKNCTEEIKENIVKNYGLRGNYDYGITIGGNKITQEQQGKIVNDIIKYIDELRIDENKPLKFKFFDRIKDLLRDLRKKYSNICDFAICSGSNQKNIRMALQENYLRDFFVTVVSETAEIKKPNPELMYQTIKEATENSQGGCEKTYTKIIMIGDTDNDINLAKEFKNKQQDCDIETIAVSYGGFQTKEHLQKSQPDIIVDSIEELKQKLTERLEECRELLLNKILKELNWNKSKGIAK